MPPSDFTEVYGDCYISGFLSGGVFNATIMTQVTRKDLKNELSAGVNVDAKFGVAKVTGKAEVSKVNNDLKTTDNTKIKWGPAFGARRVLILLAASLGPVVATSSPTLSIIGMWSL